MSGVTREIKLTKVANKLSDKENYIARISQRYSLDYDTVLDEVIERGVLRITKPMLKMILEHTLETMIENTLKDGYSRRLGDYFMLQMEVSGRFDSPDDQFDDDRLTEESYRTTFDEEQDLSDLEAAEVADDEEY